jgi:hypothetical protein
MAVNHAPETSQFRVTLFVGPQPMKGSPFTSCCVFNVKKRSWKGGVQVAVAITQSQIGVLSTLVEFPQWLAQALIDVPDEDRLSHQERAHELFIQSVCWCKLDLALQAGITQENQCLTDDTWITEIRQTIVSRSNFIMTYVASELNLTLRDITAP